MKEPDKATRNKHRAELEAFINTAPELKVINHILDYQKEVFINFLEYHGMRINKAGLVVYQQRKGKEFKSYEKNR